MSNTFDIGDRPRSSVQWIKGGAATDDPVVVSFYVQAPGADPVEYIYSGPEDPVIEKDGAGAYHAFIGLDQGGWWAHRWRAWLDSGKEINCAAEWERFYVRSWPPN